MTRESPLWTRWEKTARRAPRKVVVIEAASGKKWTAQALTAQALSLTTGLQIFRTGQRVAFQLPTGAAWLAFFLALQKEGLAAVPLDGGLPVEGAFDLARRLAARAFYAGGKWHELAPDAPARRAICCVKVTSGSSAVPKAIPCAAEHLLADGRQVCATMGIEANDRNLAALPLGHSYGLGNLVLPLLLQGTALVGVADFLPRQLVEWIARYRVTVFPSVPAIFRVLASLPPGPALGRLRLAISAGAMLSPEVAKSFHARFGVKIHNFYGSSETGGIAYDRTGEASLAGRSVGRPLRGVEVAVRAGRIVVASRAVATPAGRWGVADRGTWNTRGELVVLGRLGGPANIGGRKVHPLEVEQALRALPGVSDAHVWSEPREGRDLLAAAVETARAARDIQRALASKLPAWQMPKRWVVRAELPRTARGKVDVAGLRKRFTPVSAPIRALR